MLLLKMGLHLLLSATSSQALTLEALELLQNNKKTEALKLLEKAFQLAQDPEELREIGSLILEASPNDYSKRDAYLRYLIKFNTGHADEGKWLKELGDRAFDKGQLDEAEDWYLRAQRIYSDRNLIKYKLAWVYWNKKRRMEAWRNFLEIYSALDPSLQSQLRQDLAKLWWEIGPLPSEDFEKLFRLRSEDQQIIFHFMMTYAPTNQIPQPQDENLLEQIKKDERSAPYFYESIARGIFFQKAPCFLFQKLLSPSNQFDPEMLLKCIKDSKRPAVPILLPFLEKIEERKDERVDWAQAELLLEIQQKIAAARILLGSDHLASRSTAYLKFVSNVLMLLSEDEMKSLYTSVSKEVFPLFMRLQSSQRLLNRLQIVDPDRWIPYEEELLRGKPISKDFWLKKGIWLARKSDTPLESMVEVYDHLTKCKLTKDEKNLTTTYEKLQKSVENKLPSTFSIAFKKEYDQWIRDLDSALKSLYLSPTEWRPILQPLFQREIERNIAVMISQLESASLDPELSELSETFEQKKIELKDELRQKYLETAKQ